MAKVAFGDDVVVHSFTNLYGCRIGDNTRIGPFVEIQRGASVGANCKIQSHTFVCDGVEIGDEVFVGHGVMFINDKTPRATSEGGVLQTDHDWTLLRTVVERRASIGSGAVIHALAGELLQRRQGEATEDPASLVVGVRRGVHGADGVPHRRGTAEPPAQPHAPADDPGAVDGDPGRRAPERVLVVLPAVEGRVLLVRHPPERRREELEQLR
jgi:acetyltransferase-like isoleucine patch superfamily enzyme